MDDQVATPASPDGWKIVDDAPSDAPPEARRTKKWTVWDWVLAIDLFALAVMYLGTAFSSGAGIDENISPAVLRAGMWIQNLMLIGMMGIIPLIWVIKTRVDPKLGTIRFLQLERPGYSILYGFALLIVVMILVVIVGVIVQTFAPDLGENPVLETLAASMTIPLILATSFAAAFGEEILFRGVLQKWVGVWGQAAIFGLAHLGYGTILQVVMPFALALLFGFAVKKRLGLWAVFTAHFLYDVIALSIARYAGPLIEGAL